MSRRSYVLVAVICAGVGSSSFTACKSADVYLPPVEKLEVEVSPAIFLPIEKWDWTVDDPKNKSGREKTKLRISYRDHTIEWEGVAIPVVLREKDDRLYMIGYDRETGRKKGHPTKESVRYYRQDANQFVEIGRDDFPKEIATQNLWLKDPNKFEAVLKLDTADGWFQRSINAAIWADLLTGKIGEQPIDKKLLDEFVEKYKPIRLTAIKRPAPKKE